MQKSRLIAGRKSVIRMLVAFGLVVLVPSLYAQQNKAGSDSPQAAWSNIQQFVKDMETAVQSKNLHGIHEPSMKIRAPIKTLKQHSSMLSGDKGQKIGAALKQLDTSVTDYRLKLFSFFDDLGWRDENEFRFRIDKPGDQPWTCHAIDFRAFTSNPAHRGVY